MGSRETKSDATARETALPSCPARCQQAQATWPRGAGSHQSLRYCLGLKPSTWKTNSSEEYLRLPSLPVLAAFSLNFNNNTMNL